MNEKANEKQQRFIIEKIEMVRKMPLRANGCCAPQLKPACGRRAIFKVMTLCPEGLTEGKLYMQQRIAVWH